jgi:peptidoglycan/LPS O-acetylase OafA/YrhL
VLTYHFTARTNDAWGQPVSQVFNNVSPWSSYGALGVQLFFVISGFVILMSAWDKPLSTFVSSRIGRLFPAYWVSVLLTGVLILFFWQPGGRTTTWDAILVNLTMVHSGVGVGHVEGVYWTLWCELLFYLLIGSFLVIGITPGRVLAFCAAWPVLASLALRNDAGLLGTLLIPQYAPLFAGGMLLHYIHRQGHSPLAWSLVIFNAILASNATVASYLPVMAKNTGHVISPALVWLAVSGSFALIAVATLTPLRNLSWRWLTTCGALTYPLYLTHETIGKWVIHLVHPSLPGHVTLVLATTWCVALAWLIHRFVERPLGPRLRHGVLASLNFSPRDADQSNTNLRVPTGRLPTANQQAVQVSHKVASARTRDIWRGPDEGQTAMGAGRAVVADR